MGASDSLDKTHNFFRDVSEFCTMCSDLTFYIKYGMLISDLNGNGKRFGARFAAVTLGLNLFVFKEDI